MREIKFRGKSLDGKWLFGYIYRYVNRDGIDTVAIIEIENNGFDATLNLHKISHNTVGQCTCLRDKNGKEIYEGDIVRYSLDDRKDVGYIGFHARSASFRVIAKHTDFGIGNRGGLHELQLEVIGNIHDNFDLLEGK